MKVYVGTSGYAYKEWKGEFYPEKISPKEMLRFYAQRLSAIEINNTFYRMPTTGVLNAWAEQATDDFVFVLKAPQLITHIKRLKNVMEETEYFFNTASVLGSKLGAAFFQFPKSFRVDRPALENFLDLIPDGISCAFEFRSSSWLHEDILDILRSRGHSICTADSDENPADQIISTASWGYLRLRRSNYTDADLSLWMERILSQNWEKAFVFFKHEEQAIGPKLALRLCEMLGGSACPAPQFL